LRTAAGVAGTVGMFLLTAALLLVRILGFTARFGSARIPTATYRGLPLCTTFIASVGLYYLSVFEWLHYFDQYLCLEALQTFGHLRGWARGTDVWAPMTDFVQFEVGVHSTKPTFWTNLQQLASRLPYLIGTADGWHINLLYHPEFFFLAAATCFIILYLADQGRALESTAVSLLRSVSIFVFISRTVILIPGSYNMISGDLLFVQLYVVGGWWETFASCIVALVLVGGLTGRFFPTRTNRYFYIFLATLGVLAYGDVSMPFCNDFISIFLTAELFSIGGLSLFMTASSRTANVLVLKYLVFNVVGGILLLYGCIFIYGVTSLSDLVRLFYDAKLARSGLDYGFVVFIAGLLFKLLSLPVMPVLETVYTKLNAGLLTILVVAVEISYISLLYRTFLLGFMAPALATISQLS
jgi:hypothetical protein